MNDSTSVLALVEESQALERSGQVGAAFQCARQALALASAAGDAEAMAQSLVCVAGLEFRLSHYGETCRLAERVVAEAPPQSTARIDAMLLLGMCANESDDLSAGENYLVAAIDLSRQLGYDRVLVRGLHNLSAGVYMPRGQFDLSLAADQEALRLVRTHGMSEMAWGPLVTMSWVYWLSGRLTQAQATLEELHQASSPGSLADGYYRCTLAHIALEEECHDEALTLYGQTRAIAESLGSPELNIQVRLGMSRYCRARDDAPAGRAWAADALTIATRIRYTHMQGVALVERGRSAWAAGDTEAAQADLRAAIGVMTPMRTDFDLALAYLLLAAVLSPASQAARAPTPDARAAWLAAATRITQGGYASLIERERSLAFPLVATYLADEETQAASEAVLAALQRVPPAPLHIRLLGNFEVSRGRRPIERGALHQRRADDLLCLLLITPGRSLSRDQIIEALWPDQDPDATQMRYHHATSALRRALEPYLPDKFPSRYLETEAGQVTLRLPPGSSVDAAAFELHVRRQEWQAALALYRGDLCANALYANWSVTARETLSQLYLRALLAAAKEELAAGRPAEALAHCRRLLGREPWEERGVLVGMHACLALDDRAGALRLYRRLASTLKNELGADPMSELQTLYRSLVRKP